MAANRRVQRRQSLTGPQTLNSDHRLLWMQPGCLYEGWLMKVSASELHGDEWKQRYFRLYDNWLLYGTGEKPTTGNLYGSIALTSFSSLQRDANRHAAPDDFAWRLARHSADGSGTETVVLRAEAERAMQGWLAALGKCVEQRRAAVSSLLDLSPAAGYGGSGGGGCGSVGCGYGYGSDAMHCSRCCWWWRRVRAAFVAVARSSSGSGGFGCAD
jgi:hypothetical protein